MTSLAAASPCPVVRDDRNWIEVSKYVNEVKKQIPDKYRGDTGLVSGRHGQGFKRSAAALKEFVRDDPHLLPEIKEESLKTAGQWPAKAKGIGHRGG
ncbi:hypothetical protein [Streptosporangium pseudovulgare]|uniref:Uncharacterized protein n=1 Tax=Streptosporangium pseudovulgare TaxID=35765 RepID=A0ABQ2RM12_9ACTN|nr:hypothetical protein [Streptosporangium pseudovulgare]GGQ34894.1 hypothetical protein GCM10010140_76260 [Streptosporangium pseudovulgare]